MFEETIFSTKDLSFKVKFVEMSLLAKPEKKNNMRYNLLGNTGLRVSEICLGAMTFTLEAKNDW